MDGNIRLTLIILGIGLMVHAVYSFGECSGEEMWDGYYCNKEITQQYQFEGIMGLALFLGMIKGPKKE